MFREIVGNLCVHADFSSSYACFLHVFKKHVLTLCDYSYYVSLVESYFCPTYVVPFDEYDLPVQVTNELRKTVKFSTNLYEAIQQLKMIDIKKLQITEIEKEFVMNVQKYL